MIVVVDPGAGNLGSVSGALRRLGAPHRVSSAPEDVAVASKLILPGVGCFDAAVEGLRGLRELLARRVLEDKTPVLGICLGLQLLTEGSDEGAEPGFGWIAGRARRLTPLAPLKLPHMGWNTLELRGPSPLLAGLPPRPRFYFAHSYGVAGGDPRDVAAVAEHGGAFAAVVSRGNIHGIQFHAERSREAGLRVLRNFTEL